MNSHVKLTGMCKRKKTKMWSKSMLKRYINRHKNKQRRKNFPVWL